MKAEAYIDVKCPKCKLPMWTDKDHVRCTNPDCEMDGKRFERPTVELVEK